MRCRHCDTILPSSRKYIERGSQLFLAQVTEKEPSKKQLQDVPVIHNFPEVFLDDFPGLPPPRQVEFRIELFTLGISSVVHQEEGRIIPYVHRLSRAK
ncbi:hypothetical protein Tco_0177703 [Tanacetum coccineum]